MNDLEKQSQLNGRAIEDIGAKLVGKIDCSTTENERSHHTTHCAIGELSSRFEEDSAAILLLARGVIDNLKSTLEENRQQHAETLQTLLTSRHEGAKQISDMRDEIRQLKAEVEENLKQIAMSTGQISAEEEQRLKDAREAKYNMWMAKTLVLSKILVSRTPTKCCASLGPVSMPHIGFGP
jgi:hypothetical protein